MKSLTAALFLLVSFPSFSCPFHGLFLMGDDDAASDSNIFIGNIQGESPKAATDTKAKTFLQYENFKSRLQQWKTEKKEQQKQPSPDTSHAPVVESPNPRVNL